MKYKKYILVLMLTVFLGINKTYAVFGGEYAGSCYYMSDGLKIRIDLKYNYNLAWMHTSTDFASATIEKLGGALMLNKGNGIRNWFSRACDDSPVNCLDGIIADNETANSTKPTCPQYVLVESCDSHTILNNKYIYAYVSNSESEIQQFANDVNNRESFSTCNAYYGSATTENVYYAASSSPHSGGEKVDNDCNSIFGDKDDENSIRHMVDEILKYVQIIVPIVIIVYAAIDFFRCAIAGKEDEIKKAQSALIKRVIIGVVIIFVPVFVNLVMSLSDIVWDKLGYTTCEM